MRVLAAVAVVPALVVLGAAGGVTPGAAAQSACTVQLRVNVFGSAPPGPAWALHGGLNAGKTAILRATERGCVGLDHWFGKWNSGQAGQPDWGTHPCAGTVCEWQARSTSMSAADFQAYARTATGAKVGSNIVRVAWAGSGIAGDWAWFFSNTTGGPVTRGGCVTFTTNPNNNVTWSGGSSGSWSRAGNEITIDWRPGKTSVDTMTLSADGNTMTGTNNAGDTVRGQRGC
jgi:hypothetical protein